MVHKSTICSAFKKITVLQYRQVSTIVVGDSVRTESGIRKIARISKDYLGKETTVVLLNGLGTLYF